MRKKEAVSAISIVIFIIFIFSFLTVKIISLFYPPIINIQPRPFFYSNKLGNLKPYLRASAFSHPKVPYIYSTDNNGFRRNGSSTPHNPDELILCLGDSHTFGVSVSDSFTFPAILENRLNTNTSSTTVKVINSGSPDTGTEDNYLYYIDKAKRIRPNLVILQCDIFSIRLLTKYYRYKFSSQDNKYSLLKDWMPTNEILNFYNKYMEQFELYKKIENFLFEKPSIQEDTTNMTISQEILNKRSYEVTGDIDSAISDDKRILDEENIPVLAPLLQRHNDVILKLKKSLETENIDFLVLIIPSYRQMNSFDNVLNAETASFCKKNNIKYLDLTSKFRSLSMNDGLELYCQPYDFHCNEIGNSVIAEEISKRITITSKPDSKKSISFTANPPDFRYSDPIKISLEFDENGHPFLPENMYLEMSRFTKDNIAIRKEGDGTIRYVTKADGPRPVGSASLEFRLKKPVEQIGTAFFPHLLEGDNRSNSFTLNLSSNGEESSYSTSSSQAPDRWRDLEKMNYLLLKPATSPIDAFTMRFTFVRDGGFIFENKGAKSFRRFDILVYPYLNK